MPAVGDLSTVSVPTAIKTSAYTAQPGDFVRTDVSGGSVTVTLPYAPAAGTVIGVKQIATAGGNTTGIACSGSDVINKAGGSTSLTLTLLNQGTVLQYNSGIWLVRSDDLPLSQLEGRYLPQAQTFSLPNNTYKDLAEWTVTGQAGTLPAFGLVAGSQTYGTTPPIQGPVFWLGYNPDHLAQGGAATHGAVGMVCFANAGDTSNGAGGHAMEIILSSMGPGGVSSGACNAFQMVAIDDNTCTVNTVLRCGTGTVNGIPSNITFQNADASKTFCQMLNATSQVIFPVGVVCQSSVNFNGANIGQAYSGGNISNTFAASAGTMSTTFNGSTGSSLLVQSTTSGTAVLYLNAVSTPEIMFMIGNVNKWLVYASGTTWNLFNEINAAAHVVLTAGASTTAARSVFQSQLQSYSSLVVGNAALATTDTDGFLYLPSCPGVPTGVPTTKTGTVACVLDSTDSKLYAYIGGAWKSVTLA